MNAGGAFGMPATHPRALNLRAASGSRAGKARDVAARREDEPALLLAVAGACWSRPPALGAMTRAQRNRGARNICAQLPQGGPRRHGRDQEHEVAVVIAPPALPARTAEPRRAAIGSWLRFKCCAVQDNVNSRAWSFVRQ